MRTICATLECLITALAVGFVIGAVIEIWKTGLYDSAVCMALLLFLVIGQARTLGKVKSALEQMQRPKAQEEPEQ